MPPPPWPCADGRLFALNSYENRVYQLGAGETQLVLKFYRPQRWSDAQIAEEHQFTAELARPSSRGRAAGDRGETLLRYRDFRFAAFRGCAGTPRSSMRPRRGDARPQPARIHQIGALRAFPGPARHQRAETRLGRRAQVLASELLPPALRERYSSVAAHSSSASAGICGRRGHPPDPPPRRLPPGNLLWNEHGRCSWTWMIVPRGSRAGPVMMLAGSPPSSSASGRAAGRLRAVRGFRFSELLLIEPLRSLRMLHHAAWVAHRWSDRPSRAPFLGRRAALWRGTE